MSSLLSRVAAGSSASDVASENREKNLVPEGKYPSTLVFIGEKKDEPAKVSVAFDTDYVGKDNKKGRLYVNLDFDLISRKAFDDKEWADIMSCKDFFKLASLAPDIVSFFNLLWETGIAKLNGAPNYRPNMLIGRRITMRVKHNIPDKGKYAGQKFQQVFFQFSRPETESWKAPLVEVSITNPFRMAEDKFAVAWQDLKECGLLDKLIKLRKEQTLSVVEDGVYSLRFAKVTSTESAISIIAAVAEAGTKEFFTKTSLRLDSGNKDQGEKIDAIVTMAVGFIEEREKGKFKGEADLEGLVFEMQLGTYISGNGVEYQTIERIFGVSGRIDEAEIILKPVEDKKEEESKPTESQPRQLPKDYNEDGLDDPFAE